MPTNFYEKALFVEPTRRLVVAEEQQLLWPSRCARTRTGQAVFEEAWAEGKAMPLERAGEYALSEEELDPKRPPERSVTLTRREQKVAILVAKELTNRQIASELMLSEHTVATHVRHILKKLGLHSRIQIAAYFTGQH